MTVERGESLTQEIDYPTSGIFHQNYSGHTPLNSSAVGFPHLSRSQDFHGGSELVHGVVNFVRQVFVLEPRFTFAAIAAAVAALAKVIGAGILCAKDTNISGFFAAN
jgi:hypothetical protein